METTELSLIATFDELRRCTDVLTDGTAEIGKAINPVHLDDAQNGFINGFFIVSYSRIS